MRKHQVKILRDQITGEVLTRRASFSLSRDNLNDLDQMLTQFTRVGEISQENCILFKASLYAVRENCQSVMAVARNQAATADERILPLTLKPHFFEWYLNNSETKKNLAAVLGACKLSGALRKDKLREALTKLTIGYFSGARVTMPLDRFQIELKPSGDNTVVAEWTTDKCMPQCLMELVTEGVDVPSVDRTENVRRKGLVSLMIGFEGKPNHAKQAADYLQVFFHQMTLLEAHLGMLSPCIAKEMAMSKKHLKRAAGTRGEYAYKGKPLVGDTIAGRESATAMLLKSTSEGSFLPLSISRAFEDSDLHYGLDKQLANRDYEALTYADKRSPISQEATMRRTLIDAKVFEFV